MGLWGLAGLLAVVPAAAADRVISPTGAVHSIAVENRVGGAQSVGGTQLLYQKHSSEDITTSMVIPGTDDAVLDTEPTILLSPLTYRPVVVWTRLVGTEADIYYSFYSGITWTPATPLTQNEGLDRRPQIFWGRSGYLHIVWTGASTPDGPLMYEAVLDSKGIVVLPPGPITATAGGVVTTTGTAGPTLNVDDVLVAVDSSFKQTPRVTAQGGLDEPVPVHKRVDFILPSGSLVESPKIGVVNGYVLMMVKSGSKLYYSYQSPTLGWTTLRSVTLDSVIDARTAETMITTMLLAMEP